jgi:hypothetical protein
MGTAPSRDSGRVRARLPAIKVSGVLEEIEAPGLDLLEIRNLIRGP